MRESSLQCTVEKVGSKTDTSWKLIWNNTAETLKKHNAKGEEMKLGINILEKSCPLTEH